MGQDLSKSLSSRAVNAVYERRCQAHVAMNGRNPTPEMRQQFKKDVIHEAKKLNKSGGFNS